VTDPNTVEFLDLIADYGLSQQVSCATHDAGGTLDVVCMRSGLATQTVDCVDVGLSDSILLCMDNVTTPRGLHHVNRSSLASDRSFNQDQFHTDLQVSALCVGKSSCSVQRSVASTV